MKAKDYFNLPVDVQLGTWVPSHRGRKNLHNHPHTSRSGAASSDFKRQCEERCEELEETYLKPMKACNKWQREGRGKGEKKGKSVGETCTSTFFKHFHVMCIPTCVDHLTSSSDPDLPPYTFPMPRVAKCTGLGGGVFFQACEAGFFDVISQVLVGLGVKEGESLEVVRERKRLEREVRRREIEEVERVRREEEERKDMEENKLKESETKRESEVLVENLRGQAERMKDVEDAKKAKISSPSGGYKRVEYEDNNGNLHQIDVGGGEHIDVSIERFCNERSKEDGGEGREREECMQDVAIFFNMFHPEFLTGGTK
ncbi:hypothetical protein TrRE_jg8298 [Triparma retinervis]|uniref:Uncharacterized protein n=1 Tax=Triparma retinervis TaxID=2557542 RepID=A0A9W7E4R5_9STRA|nr:hypothetical protein TrRE_jg8298 [Triparma retinervis]